MTAPDPAGLVCPYCGSTNTMRFADGDARCFDGPHDWNPDDVTTIAPPPAVVALPETADDVLGPPADIPPASEPFEPGTLLGGVARLEGGQRAVVLSFPDDDHVEVILSDGRTEVVAYSDVESIVPVPSPEADRELDILFTQPDDETRAALLIATTMIQAAVETLESAGPGAVLGLPPVGWLPTEPGMTRAVEQAAAIALAMVIRATDADLTALATASEHIAEMTVQGNHERGSE